MTCRSTAATRERWYEVKNGPALTFGVRSAIENPSSLSTVECPRDTLLTGIKLVPAAPLDFSGSWSGRFSTRRSMTLRGFVAATAGSVIALALAGCATLVRLSHDIVA